MKEKLRIYGGARLEGEVMVSGEDSSSIRLWMGVSGRTMLKWMRTPEKDRYRLSSFKRSTPIRVLLYTIPHTILAYAGFFDNAEMPIPPGEAPPNVNSERRNR